MAYVFMDAAWGDGFPFPSSLNYTLRPPAVPRSEENAESWYEARGWRTNILYNLRPGLKGPRAAHDYSGGSPPYLVEGFLTAQHFLNLNFMRLLASDANIETFDESAFSVEQERFPYPPYSEDAFIPLLGQNLPFLILLSLLYLAQRTAKFVAVEKETGLKVWNNLQYPLNVELFRNI